MIPTNPSSPFPIDNGNSQQARPSRRRHVGECAQLKRSFSEYEEGNLSCKVEKIKEVFSGIEKKLDSLEKAIYDPSRLKNDKHTKYFQNVISVIEEIEKSIQSIDDEDAKKMFTEKLIIAKEILDLFRDRFLAHSSDRTSQNSTSSKKRKTEALEEKKKHYVSEKAVITWFDRVISRIDPSPQLSRPSIYNSLFDHAKEVARSVAAIFRHSAAESDTALNPNTQNNENRDDLIFVTKMATIFGADHLSQGDLQGSSHKVTIPLALKALYECFAHFNDDHDVLAIKSFHSQTAIDELTDAAALSIEIAEFVNDAIEIDEGEVKPEITSQQANIAHELIQSIGELSPGKGILIPSGYTIHGDGHATLLRIIRVDNGERAKKFSAYLYNEGEGLNYHPQEIDELGREWFQSFIQIDNITEEKFSEDFFYRLLGQDNVHTDSDINTVYNNFYGLGTVSNQTSRSLKPQCWTKGQLGGSCAAQSILAYLRHILPEDVYKLFKFILRSRYVLALVSHINSKDIDPDLLKVTVELIRHIEKYNHEIRDRVQGLKETLNSSAAKQKIPQNEKAYLCIEQVKEALLKNLSLDDLRALLYSSPPLVVPTEIKVQWHDFVYSCVDTIPLSREQIDFLLGLVWYFDIPLKTTILHKMYTNLKLSAEFPDTPWAKTTIKAALATRITNKIHSLCDVCLNEVEKRDRKNKERSNSSTAITLSSAPLLSSLERTLILRIKELDTIAAESLTEFICIIRTLQDNGYDVVPVSFFNHLNVILGLIINEESARVERQTILKDPLITRSRVRELMGKILYIIFSDQALKQRYLECKEIYKEMKESNKITLEGK